MGRYVARIGEMRNAYKILVRRLVGKRHLGRPKCRQENNIRMTLTETGWEGVDWIYLAQDREQWQALVLTVMDLLGSMKGREFFD